LKENDSCGAFVNKEELIFQAFSTRICSKTPTYEMYDIEIEIFHNYSIILGSGFMKKKVLEVLVLII
jgi:hypothetical protein